MTDNHTDDQHLLQQIERALAGGQASGDPLLDALATTQPQPTANFQTRLEARLMLAVQEQNRLAKEEVMSDTEKPKRQPKRWSARLPLTLVAVIAITLMGGSALLFMNNLGGPTPGFAAQAETHTPTFVPSPDPILLTATAIIVDAAERANSADPLEATATAIFEQMPADPFLLTATAIINEATRQALPPEAVTATAFIAEATMTADSAWTATAQANTAEMEPVIATVTAIVAQATASAVAEASSVEAVTGFQAVLVARDTIRRGTQITADMLTTIYVPPDLNFHLLEAERTIMAGEVSSAFAGTAEQAAGQYAMVDIPALSPLLVNDLVPENPIGRLPRGLSYPMTIYAPAEMAQSLTPGDRAQIITDLSALLTGFSADQPRLLTLVDLVEVLEIQPAEAGRSAVSVTMASNNDRQMVMDLLAWGVPLMLASPDFVIPAISDNGLTPTAEEPIIIPRGKNAIEIPLNADPTSGLQIGDRVNVEASILFIEVDGEFQAGFDFDPQQPPQLVTQTILEDAEVLQITRDTVTLAVSPEDGNILAFAVEANYPLTLVNIPAISDHDLTPTAEAAMAETLVLANDGWRMDLDENTRMVEVFIPLTDAPDNLIIGDNVGIQAEMNFRETANQTRIEIVSPEPQSSYRFHRFVAQPELIRVEADGLVVSMNQVEAVELSNALDAGLPLSLAYR